MTDSRTKEPHLPGRTARYLRIGIGLAAFLVVFTVLIHSALRGTQLGADFYTFWLAGKAMLLEQANPYGAEVTLQKQLAVYGRPALPEEDQVAFAYPPYSLLIFIPILWMSFDWAYAAWLALNVVGFLSLLFILYRPACRALSLTAILFYPAFFCLMVGNFAVAMASTVLLFFGMFAQQKNTAPGIQILSALLLAWVTSKPQFIWLFTIFILLFALKHRLHVFIGAYFSGLLTLLAVSFVYVPGWAQQWLARVQEYAGYVNSQPVFSELLRIFLNQQAALIVTGAAFIISLILTMVLFYRWWKGDLSWIQMLAWIGLITYLFHLHGIAYEQMTFLAPLVLWAGMQERWTSRPVLIFWFGSLLISWLAFAGGVGLPAAPLALAADRSAVLFNAAWVGWLLLAKTGQSASANQQEKLTTRMA